ncbi:MAG: hypothetical protein LBL85_00355 [Methanocalculaceae archaeon]|jgi:lipopolysaccharide biosynthesis glycosyltransferase|nr:hypothetical protein [Methanocalculaceae archaeon]
MNLDRLHVMFGMWDLADQYNQHIGVTITSLAMNCSLPVTVHLLYDENLNRDSPEYQDNQNKYHQLEERFGVEIFYHHIVLPNYVLHTRGGLGYFSPGWPPSAFLRIFSPDLLVNLDWIIYLDGDIVVNTDLAEIWNKDWWEEKFAVACCSDHEPEYWKNSRLRYCKKVGIPIEDYFNSGVLLMNLRKIRDDYTIVESTKEILTNHPDLPLPDQDILNIIFANDIRFLPEKYNLPAGLDQGDCYKSSCIHYIFCEKPWRDIDYPAAKEYWKYLSLSPWGDTFEKIYSTIQLMTYRSPLDKRVLTGSILNLRTFLSNLIRRGWNDVRSVKKLRW